MKCPNIDNSQLTCHLRASQHLVMQNISKYTLIIAATYATEYPHNKLTAHFKCQLSTKSIGVLTISYCFHLATASNLKDCPDFKHF
jgi:hypothetical protein